MLDLVVPRRLNSHLQTAFNRPTPKTGPGIRRPIYDIDCDDYSATLTYNLTSSPSEGNVNIYGNGTFDFDPGVDFQDLGTGETRDVTFTYTATDSHAASS